jgi:hypothetical protein
MERDERRTLIMAFTLTQFQSALNQGAGTVAGATAAAVVNSTDKVSKAFDATKSATIKTGSAIKGVMPATNKKVDTIAAKFNNRLNNLEMQQRVVDVKLSMLSQMTGVQFPTDEEIVEALTEQDEVEAAAQATQAVVDVVSNPEMISMFGAIAEKLFGINPFAPAEEEEEAAVTVISETTEVIDEDEVPEPIKQKAEEKNVATKAEKINKGRRKLGRQAPLAE